MLTKSTKFVITWQESSWKPRRTLCQRSTACSFSFSPDGSAFWYSFSFPTSCVFLTSLLQNFSRKTGFARINLDLVTRLPHDQRITSLDEKNRLLQKVVDDTPLESIISTLGSLKDTATTKRVWNAFDVAACRFRSRHSGIEHVGLLSPMWNGCR